MTVCGFCHDQPVGDAASWLDGKPRDALPCPRCGVTTPYETAGAGYRLWVNDKSTVFVRVWDSGTVEVATRKERGDLWGPPVYLTEEKV